MSSYSKKAQGKWEYQPSCTPVLLPNNFFSPDLKRILFPPCLTLTHPCFPRPCVILWGRRGRCTLTQVHPIQLPCPKRYLSEEQEREFPLQEDLDLRFIDLTLSIHDNGRIRRQTTSSVDILFSWLKALQDHDELWWIPRPWWIMMNFWSSFWFCWAREIYSSIPN